MALIASIACRTEAAAPLYPVGTEKDDGHGELARASSKFLTAEGSDEGDVNGQNVNAVQQYNLYGGDPYGGGVYGGGLYGGDPYGGGMYAGGYPAPWQYAPQLHVPHYDVQTGLTGSIEGNVSWSGAAPPRVATACGTIDNPTAHVTGNAVGGAIVYIEKVRVGRSAGANGRNGVGGAISKHGCALMPAAQIVTPLPSSFTVNGDGTKAKLVVTPPSNATKSAELQEAGIASFEAQDGVTRIDAEDGKIAPAWVIGLDTPYYAITDDRGRFLIDELAPGSYDVTVWQAPVTTAGANGAIAYGAPIVMHRSVTVDGKTPSRMDVTLTR